MNLVTLFIFQNMFEEWLQNTEFNCNQDIWQFLSSLIVL